MGVGAAIAGSALIGGATSIASGVMGSNAASDAANAQVAAADRGLQFQKEQFDTTQKNLQPFINAGESAIPTLEQLLGTAPGSNPQTIQASLENLPGFQFIKNQGLQATQNGFAAQGLGASGPALKGAANYAEGLASSQYLNLLNPYQNLVNSGSGAASSLGGIGANTANSVSGLQTGAGAAQAGGIVGGTNAITGALGGLSSNASTTALMLALNNSGMFGNNGANGNSVNQFGWGTGSGSVPQWGTGGGYSAVPFQ